MHEKGNIDSLPTSSVGSKHRLTDIGHLFLSDQNERSPVWKDTFIIPVLLSSKNDDYIVYELDQAFNQQKRSSMVLNIEASLNELGSLASIISGKGHDSSTDDANADQSLPDFCLVPVTSTSTTLVLQSDRLIIAVHSSLLGVRAAYNQLAFLASLETDFNVCVIMLGAKTTHEAKRFYEFLCDSSQSFLALELECGGFLLQDGEGIVPSEGDEKNIPTNLQGVARGILRGLTPDPKKAFTGARPPSLSAPAEASLYLT